MKSREMAVLAVVGIAGPAFGQYLLLERPTDTILVPGNTVVTTACTFEARVRRVCTMGSGRRIFAEQKDAAEDKFLAVTDDMKPLGGVYCGMGVVGSATGTVMTGDEWHHLAFVLEGRAMRFYTDGQLVGSATAGADPWNSPSSRMAIGAYKYIFAGVLDPAMIGAIDWVRISTSVRYSGDSFTPPAESALMSDASTSLLYLFNDSPGSTKAKDSGPNHWDGTLGMGFDGATSPRFAGDSAVPGRCAADFNVDCKFTVNDFIAFQAAWRAKDARADFTKDGKWTINDFIAFQAAFTRRCG